MIKIGFEVNNLTNFKVNKVFLRKVAKKALSLTGFRIPEISIVLVPDARMRNLNRRCRGKDRVTDVLAFDYGLPFGGQGEIIICLPQAKRQAKKLGHSLKKELGILLIHGILHLTGQKDITKKDFDKMNKKQEVIWQKITS